MKFICNKKILITLLISILFIMCFNIKVFAEEVNTSEDTDSVGNDKFTLSDESVNVYINGTKYILASGGDYSKDIIWQSSDPTIATVEDGKISGLKIGTTTITAQRGDETASCKVNVIYYSLNIGANSGDYATSVNLVLSEHETESLYAIVKDNGNNAVNNAYIEWNSSDSSIVTVEQNTGKLKAIKPGTATITATVAGASDTCEVTVYAAPEFTDFSEAKYELLFDTDTDLKISGISPKDDVKNQYHYIITSSNTKPEITLDEHGGIDGEQNEVEYFVVNIEENYIYDINLDKYVELNQDLYLWVIQQVRLDGKYYTEEQDYISYSTKFVAEGKKLTRPKLPQLNLILKGFDIYKNSSSQDTWMTFRFPSATENRKFTLKIGKVTDYEILKKIQNNDYSGITELLAYAKNNEAIYTSNLTTTSENRYSSEQVLFDGNSLLTDEAYYYIYAVFDDENGKYYPIEGVTLGQAYLAESSDNWWLWAYTSEEFKWNNLSPTYTETTPSTEEDTTTATTVIPNAGEKAMIYVTILIVISALSVLFYKKCNKFRDIY